MNWTCSNTIEPRPCVVCGKTFKPSARIQKSCHNLQCRIYMKSKEYVNKTYKRKVKAI